MRVKIQLECTVCKRRNYTVTKNKQTMTGRLEIKKFCASCQRHVMHREAK